MLVLLMLFEGSAREINSVAALAMVLVTVLAIGLVMGLRVLRVLLRVQRLGVGRVCRCRILSQCDLFISAKRVVNEKTVVASV